MAVCASNFYGQPLAPIPHGTDFLIRANRSRAGRAEEDEELPLLWEQMAAHPRQRGMSGAHSKPHCSPCPSDITTSQGTQGQATRLWAVLAIESAPHRLLWTRSPADMEAVEWLLLTTVPVDLGWRRCLERFSSDLKPQVMLAQALGG